MWKDVSFPQATHRLELSCRFLQAISDSAYMSTDIFTLYVRLNGLSENYVPYKISHNTAPAISFCPLKLLLIYIFVSGKQDGDFFRDAGVNDSF